MVIFPDGNRRIGKIGLNWSKNLHLDTELNGVRMFWNEQLD